MDNSPGATPSRGDRTVFARRYCIGLQAEFLILADLLAGIALIYLCRLMGTWIRPSLDLSTASSGRDLALFSVLGALMLREPGFSRPRQLSMPAVIEMMTWRVGFTLALLAAAALALCSRSDALVPGLWLAFFGIWIVLSRLIFVLYLRHVLAHGNVRETVALVGTPDAAARLAARLAEDADIVAICDDVFEDYEDDGTFDDDDDDENDSFTNMTLQADAGEIDTVVVAVDEKDKYDVDSLISRLKGLPVDVTLYPETDSVGINVTALRTVFGVPVSPALHRPMQRWSRLIKAVIDRVGAAVLLIMLFPVFIGIAVAIRWDSPGPIIFRQHRSGWAGRIFTLYKFRTMKHNCIILSEQTRPDDPRCTRLGKVLRKTSLDELPQLWNVLIGDMSLVGRPHVESLHQIERSGCQLVAEYARRKLVKPGMTGWAQVHGARGGICATEQWRCRIEYDMYYINNRSLILDLRILAMTPLAVLRAENAY
jgi:exopolysaccharide biosynthesis polyprenyl glycosylphosphotransferase